MKDFGLFAERDIPRAERIMHEMERYADRRERFLNAIDLDELDRTAAFAILRDDDDLAETLAFGHLYLAHLYTLEAQRADIAASLAMAA